MTASEELPGPGPPPGLAPPVEGGNRIFPLPRVEVPRGRSAGGIAARRRAVGLRQEAEAVNEMIDSLNWMASGDLEGAPGRLDPRGSPPVRSTPSKSRCMRISGARRRPSCGRPRRSTLPRRVRPTQSCSEATPSTRWGRPTVRSPPSTTAKFLFQRVSGARLSRWTWCLRNAAPCLRAPERMLRSPSEIQ